MMRHFLSKLSRASDNATFIGGPACWAAIATIFGMMFIVELAAIAVMIVRAG
ncbi:hypothetical protein GJU93_16635 [Brucella sp. 10RB9212]|uniref:hypothetical protein n=1 Tax=unclassified Brucella TaxID=2632610 RepID=UPI0012AD979C|nr:MULTISPECIES: hypothetical protein [unclassified Brucella]MRN48186.1 hypothetical protein [Brucella sp. 10RB9212]